MKWEFSCQMLITVFFSPNILTLGLKELPVLSDLNTCGAAEQENDAATSLVRAGAKASYADRRDDISLCWKLWCAAAPSPSRNTSGVGGSLGVRGVFPGVPACAGAAPGEAGCQPQSGRVGTAAARLPGTGGFLGARGSEALCEEQGVPSCRLRRETTPGTVPQRGTSKVNPQNGFNGFPARCRADLCPQKGHLLACR